MSRQPVFLSSLGLVNALGLGKAAVADGLFRGETGGLRLEEGWMPKGPARVGRVYAPLPELPPGFAADASRSSRLLLAALGEIRDDLERELRLHGRGRIGVVLGSSTSGMGEGERAVAQFMEQGSLPPEFHYRQQEIGRPAPFLAEYLGLEGPAITLSTACTSSGRAMATARNLLLCGHCDAVVVGGVDALSKVTVNGFTALESTSQDLCNPMSRNRKGINIGEGAALFILRREASEIALLGIGESCDAYHVSSPDPTGEGVVRAMGMALGQAGLTSRTPLYLNLHATATPKNDEMEARAVARVFPEGIPCSGTKPMTGHTLGAAAATELAFCWMALQDAWNPKGLLPPHLWDGQQDENLPALDLVQPGRQMGAVRTCLSNSMAFGGNNISLVLGRSIDK
ncbi:beta-ketoacyl-[acyl-carrier-protein] synthase family protein [Holophaga foetida]|uniref:beta-ketoacyl-[acyl-carrier-protein] synthase family protein n=1 Tax=Holophaga foetida TaxID=35839 RepID=UPI0002471C9B|nr:beta-ketoacyl-[acyl-carrier-protein] synthase family protein [Holophaga foetida]